jgi:hypothetical protein
MDGWDLLTCDAQGGLWLAWLLPAPLMRRKLRSFSDFFTFFYMGIVICCLLANRGIVALCTLANPRAFQIYNGVLQCDICSEATVHHCTGEAGD